MVEIKKGAWIVSPNGQPFRIIGEGEKKLWPGSKKMTACVVVVGVSDGMAKEIVIKKRDIDQYNDITDHLTVIMEGYRDIAGDPDEAIVQLEKDNRVLRIDLDKALKKVQEFKVAFDIAQDSIAEKQDIIDSFSGSSADIRKAAQGNGVEDIRQSYGRKKKEDDGT